MSELHRIMLLGAAGQIGLAFQHQVLPIGWQLGLYDRAEFDITNPTAVREAVQQFKPDILINAAAMTAVDAAETDLDGAMLVNFDAPAILAAQCSTHDIPFIHLSTDYVFDGDSNKPYQTEDAMNPVNVYGQSKMMGEEAIRDEVPWHVILRTSWVFSAFGNNLLKGTLKMIDERDELRMVTDQINCPTHAEDIAMALIAIASDLLKGKSGGFGTFHLCGAPACSRYELTEAIMEAYAPFTSRRPKITPTISAEFAQYARRPRYSVLDCAKIREVYGIEQRPWRDGLTAAMQQLMADRNT
jgi:dTDP-4-dehydrorhamnose reductase